MANNEFRLAFPLYHYSFTLLKDFHLGSDTWPPGCVLRFVAGDRLSLCDRVLVETLEAGHTTDVSVDMVSPLKPATYQGQWRMASATGQYFGGL